ncbi:hypothetical protein KCU94_g10, partial [Aureobasidium melanogenum]
MLVWGTTLSSNAKPTLAESPASQPPRNIELHRGTSRQRRRKRKIDKLVEHMNAYGIASRRARKESLD